MKKQLNRLTKNVSAIILVPILAVVAWSMSIPKKIFAFIPEQIVALKNGMTPIKSKPLLKEILITPKIIFVSQDEELKMKKTLHADLMLAGITQLITVVLADKSIITNIFAT